MTTYLNRLTPGDCFRLAGMPNVTGRLVALSPCSATVDLAERQEVVRIGEREFVATKRDRTQWSCGTLVEID